MPTDDCKSMVSDPLQWDSDWCRKGYKHCIGRECKGFEEKKEGN